MAGQSLLSSHSMEFRTLEHLSIAQIVTAFNRAFADYSINLEHTEASMQANFAANRVLLQGSVGAFDGDVLVGFMLHGFDVLDGQQTVQHEAHQHIAIKSPNRSL